MSRNAMNTFVDSVLFPSSQVLFHWLSTAVLYLEHEIWYFSGSFYPVPEYVQVLQ